jgi:riboflavin synthase
MFSGIVEEIGRIQFIKAIPLGFRFDIHARKVLRGTRIGDSIAVDGICLTVVKKRFWLFSVDVMKETIDRTALKQWQVGTKVNLQRALASGERNGGHQVQGHVDGVGSIIKKTEEGIATRLRFAIDPKLTTYMIQKGSIAIDGISLTLTDVQADNFEVSLIPHTKVATTIYEKHVGDVVNIEVDYLAKYIEKMMGK